MITLATNLMQKGTSQFDNWNFTSYSVVYGYILATNPEGLFVIGETTDDGEIIPTSIKLKDNDFGLPNSKKFPYLYLVVKAEANFILDISVDGTSIQVEVPVNVKGIQTIRVPLTRKLRGHMWTISIKATKGKYFSIFNIKGLPTILHAGRA